MILGDNFYDQNGLPTSEFFSKVSDQTNMKLSGTIPGNHDYWLCGSQECYDKVNDQLANEFMQFYGQDAFVSLSSFPYDFSINPDEEDLAEKDLRANSHNFHLAYQIGNVGVIGYSGAGKWEEQESMFSEACASLSTAALQVLFVVGHRDIPVYDLPNGLQPGMSVEGVHA